MAKGLYLMSDGQMLVEVRQASPSSNSVRDKLPPEIPRKARKEIAHAEA